MREETTSPVARILFILFVTIVILITYFYWETKLGAIKGLARYVEIIERVATLVSILVGIYMIQFYFSQAAKQERHRIAADLQQGTVEIQKLFLDPHWYMELQPLYMEMHPMLAENSKNPPSSSDAILPSEYMVGNIIFRRMEAVL